MLKPLLKQILVIVALSSCSIYGQARVFDINEKFVSSYFKGRGGMHGADEALISGTEATDVTYDASASSLYYTGEVGFAFSGRTGTFRIAAESLTSLATTAKGNHSSGTKYYDLTSQVQGLLPKIGFDMHIKQWKDSRVYLGLEVGQGTLTLTNEFKMTSSGSTALSTTDFSEKGEVSAQFYEAHIAYEALLADATTFIIDLGYRQLSTEGLKVSEAYTGFNGAVAKGAELTNEDGDPRKINFSGAVLGIAFRFYL